MARAAGPHRLLAELHDPLREELAAQGVHARALGGHACPGSARPFPYPLHDCDYIRRAAGLWSVRVPAGEIPWPRANNAATASTRNPSSRKRSPVPRRRLSQRRSNRPPSRPARSDSRRFSARPASAALSYDCAEERTPLVKAVDAPGSSQRGAPFASTLNSRTAPSATTSSKCGGLRLAGARGGSDGAGARSTDRRSSASPPGPNRPRGSRRIRPSSAAAASSVGRSASRAASCQGRQRLQRGVFRSVADLEAAINRFVAETNNDPKPFLWTADPKRILAAVKRGKQALESLH